MTIHVLPIDIHGADRSASNSPIARACRRELQIPRDVHVAVWSGRLQIGSRDEARCYYVPPHVDLVDAVYTHNRTMEPFDFELRKERVPCDAPCRHDPPCKQRKTA